jgi:hypothetical protein
VPATATVSSPLPPPTDIFLPSAPSANTTYEFGSEGANLEYSMIEALLGPLSQVRSNERDGIQLTSFCSRGGKISRILHHSCGRSQYLIRYLIPGALTRFPKPPISLIFQASHNRPSSPPRPRSNPIKYTIHLLVPIRLLRYQLLKLHHSQLEPFQPHSPPRACTLLMTFIQSEAIHRMYTFELLRLTTIRQAITS